MERIGIFRHLHYLLAVDEHRNFTRAAEALGISQSALSQQIRQLEKDLGGQLFDRSGRVVLPTDFGVVYIEHSRRAVRDLAAGQRALHDVQDLSRGRLRIAFTPTFTEYLMAPVVEQFYAMHPGISVELAEMPQSAVEHALERDQVDIAIGFVDVRSEEIEVGPLFSERQVLVVGRSHPLATQRHAITPERIAAIPLALLAENFVSRFYVDSYFRSHAIQPVIAMQVNSISAVLKIVERGKIATILPSAMAYGRRQFRAIAFDPAMPIRTAALLRRKNAYRSSAALAFTTLLRTMLETGSLSFLPALARLPRNARA